MKSCLKYCEIFANWSSNECHPLKVVIETERLIIRSIQLTDLPSCIQLFGCPTIMSKYAEGKPRTKEQVEEYVKKRTKRWQINYPFSSFVLIEKATHAFVGHIDIDESEQPSAVELGYILLPDFHGNGYATEAARALIYDYIPLVIQQGYLVRGLPIKWITAVARVDNSKSIHLIEKLGLTFTEYVCKYSADPRRFYCLPVNEILADHF